MGFGPRAPGFRAWQGPELVPGVEVGCADAPFLGWERSQGVSRREKEGGGGRGLPSCSRPVPASGPCCLLKPWTQQVRADWGWGWDHGRSSAHIPSGLLLNLTWAGVSVRPAALSSEGRTVGLGDSGCPFAFGLFAFSLQFRSVHYKLLATAKP